MKNFNRMFISILVLLIMVVIGINLYLSTMYHNENGREYLVEMNRLSNEIKNHGIENINLEKYSYIFDIAVFPVEEKETDFFEGNGSDYIIRNIEGTYYRFDYRIQFNDIYRNIQVSVNLGLIVMMISVLAILIYIRIQLINPFHKIKDVPYELSKGNLTFGLKENKSRFFGKFVWGLDLLREHLELQKTKDLTMQKEKKTLILSISHDIKTPLSAIKLYSKALLRNLYDTEEKRIEVAENIGARADEIERFVSEIIKTSSEDFLNLEVKNSEYYLEDLIKNVTKFYEEKLAILKIEFKIDKYSNCLLKGDINRAIEVLQNLMENAIKYGDGKYINIHISSEEDCRLVTIANSGCTFSKNELPYIFDSFWRGSNVGNHNGNGLGLYICRQLMRKMDGDIFAECVDYEMRVTAVFRMI